MRKVSRLSFLKLMAPLLLFELYLLLTILLFRFGPWKYYNQNSNEIFFFALLYQSSIALGYVIAHVLYRKPIKQDVNLRQVFTISLIVNFLIFPLTSLARTGILLPDFFGGLRAPGEAYARSLIYRETGAGAVIEYIRIFLGPLIYIYFPLSIFYWNQIGRKTRFWSVILIMMNIALFVAMGTNKAIGDYAVTIPILLLTAVAAGLLKLTVRRIVFGVLLILVLAGIFTSFFSATMSSRAGSSIVSGYFPPGNTRVDPQNALLQAVPEASRTLVVGLSNYITQGYFAMGLALREPFIPLYGLGTSPFILRQYETLTGIHDFEEQTYPARIEKYGWLKERYWSSMYLWLASDLGFWGIPLFCILFGIVLYTTWRDTIESRNIWALNLVALHVTVLFYFSSNNQIGQSGEALWTYLAIFFMWAVSRQGIRFTMASRRLT
ncbi:hypothetical protein GO986_14580 [Deinococcus sp. HMF7620]|uniref:Oligosaccharide repeat unit polymerase n=1 Tax=Deinococcus arboris TaxID=2682977 RepID=A0A7C9LVQ8_9DEIO|nr:hypothetical protein [Deinococcus arboris]MVN87980.1 hypothetical protein [Deinococcus arboris]